MQLALVTLINRLDSSAVAETSVIKWGCPVPSFGDLSRSRVATLGLNPSNREFVDLEDRELDGTARRFHTLNSLGLESWLEVDSRHLQLILESCRRYFDGNPYDRWFRMLDDILSATEVSYYNHAHPASHLDLIPYATSRKWTDLNTRERSFLLTVAQDTLGILLRDSPVELLILNGSSVVNAFEVVAGVHLDKSSMATWSLPRLTGRNVPGFAYQGEVDTVAGVRLGRKILVLGFNHNIQSSFGVTTEVRNGIRQWISRSILGARNFPAEKR